MTTSTATSPSGAPRNLLSVLWLQARALFERLARVAGDYARRIPALEALVRAYVCGAANDRLVADSALRRRLTEAADQMKERLKERLLKMAGAARDHARDANTPAAPTQARLHAPRFNPLPSVPAMRDPEHPDHSGPHVDRPRAYLRPRATSLATSPGLSGASGPAPDAHAIYMARRLSRLSRFDPATCHFTTPDQRLAAVARVLADPEPAIRRAMRLIAARWDDPTMALPQPEPEPDSAGDMPDEQHGEPAHIAHPRPQLAAARDRPGIEIAGSWTLTPDGWVEIHDDS